MITVNVPWPVVQTGTKGWSSLDGHQIGWEKNVSDSGGTKNMEYENELTLTWASFRRYLKMKFHHVNLYVIVTVDALAENWCIPYTHVNVKIRSKSTVPDSIHSLPIKLHQQVEFRLIFSFVAWSTYSFTCSIRMWYGKRCVFTTDNFKTLSLSSLFLNLGIMRLVSLALRTVG